MKNPVHHKTPLPAGRLTPEEAALIARRDPRTIRRWVERGLKLPDGRRLKLRGYFVGRTLSINRSDLAAFLEGVETEDLRL